MGDGNSTECSHSDQYGREMSRSRLQILQAEEGKLNGLEFEDYVFSIRMTYLGDDDAKIDGADLAKDRQIEITAR